ncbi:MAG: DUF721 domain-containing protein [Bacteroidales bacterium]|jgi:hypothetical protein|nr:DUF721 domain-containing protein [Bacteroidales bacterium]
MEKTDFKSLDNIISKMIEQTPNLQDDIDRAKIPEIWKEVVGPTISDSTQEIKVNRYKIFVKINNPIIKHEILLMKHSILFDINNKLGRKLITELILR